MRISLLYQRERTPLDIPKGKTVAEIKKIIRDKFMIESDDGRPDKKILVLSYAGGDLQDAWSLEDVGIRPGATLKLILKEKVKPVLYVYCVYNTDTLHILDQIHVPLVPVEDIRSMISKRKGLPIGVFRIVNTMGKEMYDGHLLEDYGVDFGHTIRLETWDGWNDFLNLAANGFSSHVMARLSTDELTAFYQMKVAMFVAAHFGHIDLGVTLCRQGIRPDERIGNHPYRQWCSSTSHIESKKTPVHQAAEMGQLGILRTFVTHNVSVMTAKDGNGLKPLNVAIRAKQQACVSYLLSKQYTRIVYSQAQTLPLVIYAAMKNWCEHAKQTVFKLYGWEKSSLRKRPYGSGALVGQGVHVDGYTKSEMNASPRPPEKVDHKKRLPPLESGEPPMDYETYFKTQATKQFKLPNLNKWDRMSQTQKGSAQNIPVISEPGPARRSSVVSINKNKRKNSVHRKLSIADSGSDVVRLPPIKEGQKLKAQSGQNLSVGKNEFPDDLESVSGIEESEDLGLDMRDLLDESYTSTVSLKSNKTKSPSKSTKQNEKPNVKKKSKSPEDDSKQTSHAKAKDTLKKKLSFQRKKKQERAIRSAVLLAKAKTENGPVPLPLISVETVKKPHFYGRNKNDGFVVTGTLNTYAKYRGTRARDYAIRCLGMANTFKEKPWLQQVQLAMNFCAQNVKRATLRRARVFP